VLGLAWDQIDLDAGQLYVGEQLQRVRHELVLREVKTEASEAPLPLPDLCVAALKVRNRRQDADRAKAGDRWIETGLVFTTRHGTPSEPRNFNRSFDRCTRAARVPRITVHGTRKTCARLLVALDVHPCVAMRILRHSKIKKAGSLDRNRPLSWVELRGFEPLTPSMRTRIPMSASMARYG
jgi:integrase